MFQNQKKGTTWELASLTFTTKKSAINFKVEKDKGIWLQQLLTNLADLNENKLTMQEVKNSYEAAGLEDFELFWDNKPVNQLYKSGLLLY